MGVVVHQPIHGWMQVSPGDNGHVYLVRERVVSIQHDQQREGQPARGKHEINDKQSPRQLQRRTRIPSSRFGLLPLLDFLFPVVQVCFLCCYCSINCVCVQVRLIYAKDYGGFGFGVVFTVAVDFQPRFPHVQEKPDVGQTGDENRYQDHDDCEDYSVIVVGHPVPDALQTLMVERVIPDADEVESDQDEADEEEAEAHNDAVSGGEDFVVVLLVADEDVAVAAHSGQCHQGTHTGDGAQAAYGATKSWKVAEEPPAQRLS